MRKTEKAGSRNMGTQERRANQTGSHSVARKRAKCTKGSKGNSMQANKDEDFNKDESGRGAGKPWDFPGTASHLLTPTCRLAHTHVQKREGGSAGDGVVCWKAPGPTTQNPGLRPTLLIGSKALEVLTSSWNK